MAQSAEAHSDPHAPGAEPSCHHINVAIRFRPLRFARARPVPASNAQAVLQNVRAGLLTLQPARGSVREHERGECEIWGIVAPQTVGVVSGPGVAQYGFDHVFGGLASNAQAGAAPACLLSSLIRVKALRQSSGYAAQVYDTTAKEIVAAAMDGAAPWRC